MFFFFNFSLDVVSNRKYFICCDFYPSFFSLVFVWLLCLYFISLDCPIMYREYLVMRKPQLSQTFILDKICWFGFSVFQTLAFCILNVLSLSLPLDPKSYVNYLYKFKLSAWSMANLYHHWSVVLEINVFVTNIPMS